MEKNCQIQEGGVRKEQLTRDISNMQIQRESSDWKAWMFLVTWVGSFSDFLGVKGHRNL